MKKFFTLIFALCVLVCSCEKYNMESNANTISGLWKTEINGKIIILML